MRQFALPAVLLALLAAPHAADAADEVSSGDKLRMLYSNQFTFTDDGVPLVTIEVMSGRREVTLVSRSGMKIMPDGPGGATLELGTTWTVRVEDGKPAILRDWVVAESHHPDADSAITAAIDRWKQRGFKPRTFEIGTLFGVSGEIMDTRRVLIAVSPNQPGPTKGVRRRLRKDYGIDAEVHREVVKLPRGTIVGRSGNARIQNPSVLWFAPTSADATITVKDVTVGGGGSQLKTGKEDRRYFGSVFVTVGKDGSLVVVNSVPADRLLAGLVPSEIFPSAPNEALRAQAVAARTELLEKLGKRHFGDPFLLCSSQQCQVYSGAGKEHPRTTRAVKETRGLVLRRGSGELVDARYSASCGGFTSDKTHIWGGRRDSALVSGIDAIPGTPAARRFAGGIDDKNIEAFLRAPADQFNEGKSRHAKGRFRWTKRVPRDVLDERIRDKYPQVGSLRAIEPLSRGRSGRARRVRLVGSRGTAIAEGDLHIRRLLGGLRSTLFVVRTEGPKALPNAFVFRGGGFGHGVGMCQVGAIGMAKQNTDFRRILSHYYRGSSVRKLY